jgi:hypothetical protein
MLYALVHAAISFVWAQDDKTSKVRKCNIITGNPHFDSVFWVLINLANLILWQYPLIIIMWPGKIV